MVTPTELRERAALLKAWGQFELGMVPPAALDYQDTVLKLEHAAQEIERLQDGIAKIGEYLDSVPPRSGDASFVIEALLAD